MDFNEAQETLLREVYIPEFVKECAARGIAFADEEQLTEALKSASMLKMAEAQAAAEEIEGQGDLHKAASAMLSNALGFENEEVKTASVAPNEKTTAAVNALFEALKA